jgi:beta-glucanase (GH16 family)
MINASHVATQLSPSRRSRSPHAGRTGDRRPQVGRRASWPAALAGLIVALTFAAAQAAPAQAQTPVGPPTWSDEFDGSSLDMTRWSYRGTGARFDGILTPAAVSVGDGVLTIKTYTEAGQHYSGMISTQKHGSEGFEQAYGTFEARVKFNSSPGQWSAFWLQSPTIGSPIGDPANAGVETDIAEHRARCETAPSPSSSPSSTSPTSPSTCKSGDDISDRTQRALIWDGYGADRKAAVRLSDPLAGLGNDSWHTFAVRWTPTEMTFSYDGAAIWSASGPISRRSQFIILSSEVGRFFAGAIPTAGYGSRETSRTSMQVDYVRVWAPAPQQAFRTIGSDSAPPVDRTVPIARLFAQRTQTLRAAVVVKVLCPDEACRATATGTVRVPGLGRAKAATYTSRAPTATIARGARTAVKLTLSRSARAAIARALRAGRRIVLKLGVRVADEAGNILPGTRQVTLKR